MLCLANYKKERGTFYALGAIYNYTDGTAMNFACKLYEDKTIVAISRFNKKRDPNLQKNTTIP